MNYNDSAQKTPAVRKNVRGMNAPITNNATTGSVSLETVKQYIESQRSEEHQAKKNQQFQKKTLLE